MERDKVQKNMGQKSFKMRKREKEGKKLGKEGTEGKSRMEREKNAPKN